MLHLDRSNLPALSYHYKAKIYQRLTYLRTWYLDRFNLPASGYHYWILKSSYAWFDTIQ